MWLTGESTVLVWQIDCNTGSVCYEAEPENRHDWDHASETEFPENKTRLTLNLALWNTLKEWGFEWPMQHLAGW